MSKTMKIFLVCNSLGGGGAERVHVNLANGFAQRGHEVYLIADVNQPASYPVDEQVHVLPLCPQSTNKLKKWGGAVSMLRKNIKKYKPDVVIGNMHLCSLLSKIAALGTGIPVILTIHNALERPASYQVSKMTTFSDEYLSYLYKKVTVLTEADKEYLGGRKNLVVMPNPLTFPPSFHPEKKEYYVLAAGRLDSWYVKGFDLLIEAWGKVFNGLNEEQRSKWHLFIAGQGSDTTLKQLKKRCLETNVGNSIVWGGYQSDIKQIYEKASIYALSSRSEGFPMVLIEAMSQGCACVATDFKGRTREILRNDNDGIICSPNNVEGLSMGLMRLIQDDELRNSLQHNAYLRSYDFTTEKVVDKWESMITNIR